MTIDVYQPCPCGSGSKIKFCCCKDITNDLGKVIQKLDAEQRAAALDQVTKVIEERGNRPALLAIKAIAELQLGNDEGAAGTVATFLAEHPENSVALALSATVKSEDEDPRGGIEPLQRALEKVGETFPAAVYESIGALAEALLMEGHIMAARAHYLLQAGLAGNEDKEVNEVLARLSQSPQLPLILKQTPQLDECPDDWPLKSEFDQALDLAGKGMWLAAVELFTQLLEKWPDEPSLYRNRGILYCCLGNVDEAAKSLHRYAASNGEVELDDKVEAEALAQLIDRQPVEDKVLSVMQKYPVEDMEKLLEKFTDDGRIELLPVDPSTLAREDAPPPKGVFYLLDRAMPETKIVTQRQEIPNVLGELYLFGRETDQEARLEVVFTQDEDFEKRKSTLTDIAGDLLGEPSDGETVREISKTEAALIWSWRIPPGVPVDQREDFVTEQRREVVLEKWPQTGAPALNGKTPLEVKDDPAFRVPLLAAVWLMELNGEMQLWQVDYDELRTELGLPLPDAIDPTDIEIETIPLTRLSRLLVDKLADDQLALAFQRAFIHQAHNATRATATELLARPSLAGRANLANLHGALMKAAQDSRTGLDQAHLAQQAARGRNESPAQWLIAELSLRIRRGEMADFQRVVQELQTRHMREPGVAQAVTQIMLKTGLISPEQVNAAVRARAASGGPLGRQPGTGPGMMPAGPPPVAPSTPAPDDTGGAGGVWTPDAPAQTDQPPEKKSKIWTPGMD